MMKRSYKLIVTLMMVAAFAFTMTACGGYKTPEALSGIDEESGIHMEYVFVDGDSDGMEMDTYLKGDSAYIETNIDGEEQIIIVEDDTAAVLNVAKKEGSYLALDDTMKSSVETMKTIPKSIETLAEVDDFEKGETKIDGVNYYSETADADGNSVTFAYNDDDKLKYMVIDADGEETTLEIKKLSGDVPDDRFDIPGDYKMYGSKSSASSGTDSGSDKKVTTGSTQAVDNTSGGYTFSTGKDYIIDKSDEYTYVYLEKKDTLPFYSVLPMVQVSGATVETKISDMIKTEKDKYKERMTGEPKRVSINAGDRTIQGMEFAYSSENGEKTIQAGHYFELRGSTFYSWNYSQVKGETKSKGAMEQAMQTFRLK